MKHFTCWSILIATIAAVVISACDRSTPHEPMEQPAYSELDWVGTDVIYSATAEKHDVSIIFFMAEWCGWCKRLKNESLADSTVIQILGESYNIAWINPDADSSVVCGDSTVTCRQMTNDVFGVRGFPTIAFCRRSGELIGLAPGYKPVADFVDLLERMRDGEY